MRSLVAAVALLAEGVDRNYLCYPKTAASLVALLAEGVDRNFLCLAELLEKLSRPPRGGRG